MVKFIFLVPNPHPSSIRHDDITLQLVKFSSLELLFNNTPLQSEIKPAWKSSLPQAAQRRKGLTCHTLCISMWHLPCFVMLPQHPPLENLGTFHGRHIGTSYTLVVRHYSRRPRKREDGGTLPAILFAGVNIGEQLHPVRSKKSLW